MENYKKFKDTFEKCGISIKEDDINQIAKTEFKMTLNKDYFINQIEDNIISGEHFAEQEILRMFSRFNTEIAQEQERIMAILQDKK